MDETLFTFFSSPRFLNFPTLNTFVYLSDEPMDCITKIGDNVEEESENRMLDETKTH